MLDEASRNIDALYRRAAAQMPRRVSYVSITDLLCNRGDQCPAVVDGRLARVDGVHYTATFSRRIVPIIVRRAQRAGVTFAPASDAASRAAAVLERCGNGRRRSGVLEGCTHSISQGRPR